MTMLSDLRVVEVGTAIRAAYATKLLSDLGATVTRAVPSTAASEADPVQTALDGHLNARKQSVTIDLDTAEGFASFDLLLSQSDLLVNGLDPASSRAYGLHPQVVQERHPGLVLVTVSPFGWGQPEDATPATDLDACAMGAVSFAIGSPAREPLSLPYRLADYVAATQAAAAGLAAWRERATSGRGQWVDVSVAEVLAWCTVVNSQVYVPYGIPWARAGSRASGSGGPYPYGIFPCKDGYVCLIARSTQDWRNFLTAMGNPPWSNEPRYLDQVAMGRDYPDEVDELVKPLLARHTRSELLDLARTHGFPLAPVNPVEAVLKEPHYRDRGFFVQQRDAASGIVLTLPGRPYQFRECTRPAASARASTTARTDAAGRLPLSGIRVLDLAWVWSGPLVSSVMADLGAEVIKVEHSGRLDNSRLRGRPRDRELPAEAKSIELGPYFHMLNRGKLSLTLNLKDPRGAALLRRLASVSDVVVENLSPGALDSLGAGYQDLAAANPRIIYLSMSAAGHSGPLRSMRAYAPIMSSITGLESLVGYPGEDPTGMMTMGLSDPNAGGHALVAVLSTLCARERTGVGCHIDMSQIEATLATLAEPLIEQQLLQRPRAPMGNRSAGTAPRGVYPAKGDERWITIAVTDDAAWRRLASLIVSTTHQERSAQRDPSWAYDPDLRTLPGRLARQDALDQLLSAWTRSIDRDSLVTLLRSHRICASPVLSIEEVLAHPYFVARALTTTVQHPVVGEEQVVQIPWKFSRTPARATAPAPLLGQHNDAILRGLLQLDEDEIEGLTKTGVIA